MWGATLSLCKYPVLIQGSSSSFSINWMFLAWINFTIIIDKWQSSNSITPFKCIIWPSKEELFLLPYIYSFTYLCHHGLMDPYSIQWDIMLLLLFILMLKLAKIWHRFGLPFKLTAVSFWCAPSVYEHFITFWYKRMLQTHLVLSMSQTWSQPFL